jgi:hypothetical protein
MESEIIIPTSYQGIGKESSSKTLDSPRIKYGAARNEKQRKRISDAPHCLNISLPTGGRGFSNAHPRPKLSHRNLVKEPALSLSKEPALSLSKGPALNLQKIRMAVF